MPHSSFRGNTKSMNTKSSVRVQHMQYSGLDVKSKMVNITIPGVHPHGPRSLVGETDDKSKK